MNMHSIIDKINWIKDEMLSIIINHALRHSSDNINDTSIIIKNKNLNQ